MRNKTQGRWIPASDAWMEFARNHPEFGVKPTEGSWIYFQRVHAKALIEADVIRRIAYRGRMLANTQRFDAATFNLLTTGNVEGRSLLINATLRPNVGDIDTALNGFAASAVRVDRQDPSHE